MSIDCFAVGTDCRKPVHEHEPDPNYRALSQTQQQALRYARTDGVRILISACGPDEAVRASVDHTHRPYWKRAIEYPQWATYKSLYLHGVIRLVQDNPAHPYFYKAEPVAAHPLNKLPVPAPTLAGGAL